MLTFWKPVTRKRKVLYNLRQENLSQIGAEMAGTSASFLNAVTTRVDYEKVGHMTYFNFC